MLQSPNHTDQTWGLLDFYGVPYCLVATNSWNIEQILPLLTCRDKDKVFAPPSTVRVSTKLLKILIAALSPPVAY